MVFKSTYEVHVKQCCQVFIIMFFILNNEQPKSKAKQVQQVSLPRLDYKRRPRRPPFLRVLSEGIGVTSSTNHRK